MGSCISHVDPESLKLHAEAEEILRKAKRRMNAEAKVLLLGAGDSGKSTVIKQMRILTRVHWTRIELESYRQIIFLNLIDGMKGIFQGLEDLGTSLKGDESALDAYNCILKASDVQEGEPFPRACYEALRFLWSHPHIQDGLMRSALPLPDNIHYYFPELDRLFAADYVPSDGDILHTRARTTGIVEYFFNTEELSVTITETSSSSGKMKSSTDLRSRSPQSLEPPKLPQTLPSGSDAGTLKPKRSRTAIVSNLLSIRPVGARHLHMIDVGGQRSERRKWIHVFEGVTAILFLVSLSGYDQSLVEAREANQMMDAMTIWDGICSLNYFRYTDMILFLNKVDLFEQKVRHSPINRFFPDYQAPEKDAEAAEAGKEYFKKRFMHIATKSRHWRGTPGVPETRDVDHAPRAVYQHFTTVVNTMMIAQVMVDVTDIILRENFTHTNLI